LRLVAVLPRYNALCHPDVGYRWVCNTCKNGDKTKVYEGETARSARLRGIEHIRALNKKHFDSVLYKHQIIEHENEDADFQMEITGVFKDAISRQADEAVRINSRQSHELMNSKSQFNHPPVARIVVEKNLKRGWVNKRAQLSPGL
jgi:hypothetical protein